MANSVVGGTMDREIVLALVFSAACIVSYGLGFGDAVRRYKKALGVYRKAAESGKNL
jgi:hypothetical protein